MVYWKLIPKKRLRSYGNINLNILKISFKRKTAEQENLMFFQFFYEFSKPKFWFFFHI